LGFTGMKELLEFADAQLYQAKKHGRNRIASCENRATVD